MTHLYLIRHGESYANADWENAVVPGLKGDKGLTPRGREQAERLRERLARTGEIQADVALASPLRRAWQTAEIVVPALGLSLVEEPDIEEMRGGEADGMTVAAVKARYGLPDYRKEPYRRLSPGGENWGEFLLRAGSALERIAREYAGKTVVLFTHGGIIDASFLVFMGLHTLTPPPFELYTHNTSITEWELHHHEDAPPRWRLVRYNDDTHVRDLLTQRGDTPATPLPTEERGE